MVRAKTARRQWALKMRLAPIVSGMSASYENDRVLFSIDGRAYGGQMTYLIVANFTKSQIWAILDKWNAGDIKPEDLYEMTKDHRLHDEGAQTDQFNAERLMELSGPMVPEDDRSARYSLERLLESHGDIIGRKKRAVDVERTLEQLTEARDSELIPPDEKGRREKGLFAKVDIPKGTWIGEYLGPSYNAIDHDSMTYVFAPPAQDEGLNMMERFDKYGRVGETLLKWANDAPVEDIVDWAGRPVKAANMRPDGYDFYAKVDIPAGTELTWNYQGGKWRAYDDPDRQTHSIRR